MSTALPVPSTDGAIVGLLEPGSLTELLTAYGWKNATFTHLGTSENVTLRVTTESDTAILRIYRIGHRSRNAIDSELAWMDALRDDVGISTPEALPTLRGERIGTIATSNGDTHCVAFRCLPGSEPAQSQLKESFYELGVLCARMHNHAAAWLRSTSLHRPRLDWDCLIGSRPIWGPWDRVQGLELAAKTLLQRVAGQIKHRLDRYGTDARVYGLIHGDLRLQNLLVDGNTVHVIDFDDCSFCWRLYDLATALSLIEDLPAAPELLNTWLSGYQTFRSLEPHDLESVADLVMMRRFQVLGWLASRSHTALAGEVSSWYVPATVTAAEDYLAKKPRLRAGI